MKMIVGLGNPGRQYENTRHNVGFEVADLIASRIGAGPWLNKGKGLVSQGLLAGERVLLVKPLTYMNLSGEFVGPLAAYYQLTPEDVLVICDDINLALGQLRFRVRGSAGGHNGLKNLILHLSSENFPRIRCGVGFKPEPMDLADFVLSHYSALERKCLDIEIGRAADAAALLLEAGPQKVMNEFNKKVDDHGEVL